MAQHSDSRKKMGSNNVTFVYNCNCNLIFHQTKILPNSDLVMVLVLCLILLWNQVVLGDFCE